MTGSLRFQEVWFGFGFLGPSSRQDVLIEKLIPWKLGTIRPALLPVGSKSSGKLQLPLWPTFSTGKLKTLGQMILRCPPAWKPKFSDKSLVSEKLEMKVIDKEIV